jgi:SOS-response transcriptional repressor LexA
MQQELTGIQRNVLEQIENIIKARGFAPTHAEVARAVGVSEPRARHIIRTELTRKGFVSVEFGKARAIRVLKPSTEVVS